MPLVSVLSLILYFFINQIDPCRTTAQCEPLEDSTCLGVQLPYSHTSLALTGLPNQRIARVRTQTNHFLFQDELQTILCYDCAVIFDLLLLFLLLVNVFFFCFYYILFTIVVVVINCYYYYGTCFIFAEKCCNTESLMDDYY